MKQSASLLIQNPAGKYLLIRRSRSCKHFVGLWEFPGGKLNPGETPHAALLREVHEEIGAQVPVPDGKPMREMPVPDGGLLYSFFKWQCPDENLAIKLSDEHDESKWVTFAESRKMPMMEIHREFLEWQWLQNQIRVYNESEHQRYELYSETLQKVLERLKRLWAPLAIVQTRAKDLTSFAEKCLRKADKYDRPVFQLTDLCGGRIITTTTDEAEVICRQIRKLFYPVDEEDDTRIRHGISAFGYLSVHFLVHFPAGIKEMLGVPIPSEITGLKAEVQVRSLLQHAHSEVTHDRLYKAGYRPPQHCEREAARVAAALETADVEFTRFVRQLDAYVGTYAAHLAPTDRQRRLADLKLVLEAEGKPDKKPFLALRMARLCRAAWDWAGVISALDPFARAASGSQPAIDAELGNALCQFHGDSPDSPEYRRGLRLLKGVAQPETGASIVAEVDERQRRATALAWLGSALSKCEGSRDEARNCLSKSVELAPENPYYLLSFVELDVIASGTNDQVPLLAPALRQAAGRCEEHLRAGIEVTRAWLTISEIHLLLGEETGAIEALCAAARQAETYHPLGDFQHSLARLKDAIGKRQPFVALLHQTTQLLVTAKKLKDERNSSILSWEPFERKFEYAPETAIIILAGSTATEDNKRLAAWKEPLMAALTGFHGSVLTGGTCAGICNLAVQITNDLARSPSAKIQLVGYLPSGATPHPEFHHIVKTDRTQDFSLREPLQMWADLLMSGVAVHPANVTLLCICGGEISAQELALAWALGARAAALDGECVAPRRFSNLMAAVGDAAPTGILIPDDPATIRMFFQVQQPGLNKAWEDQWEQAGQAVHEDYVKNQRKRARQPNLLPWEHLSEDFKHSNRHQAACSAGILQEAGFIVERAGQSPIESALTRFSDAEVETMAQMEHGRWNTERLTNGWRYAAKKDEARRLSPYLVSWNKLPDEIKGYDRTAVRAWPKILAQAGLVVRRKA